jgi:hypothetical protein
MRIVDVRERTFTISSPIRNAYIHFSRMTLSLVAVVTDVDRDGRPVVGYGFNSNGRYGQGGMIRERFAPRLPDADPAALVDDAGDNLDPGRVWAAMMTNPSTWRCGTRWPRSPTSRCSTCWPIGTATASPIGGSSSTRRAATTTRSGTCPHWQRRCPAIWTAATPW